MSTNVIRQDIVQIDFDIINNPFSDLNRTIQDFINLSTGSLDGLNDLINNLGNNNLRNLNNGTSDLTDNLDDLMRNTIRITDDLNNLGDNDLRNLNNGMSDLTDGLNDLIRNANRVTDNFDDLGDNDLRNLNNGMSDLTDSLNDLIRNTRRATDSLDDLGNSDINNLSDDINNSNRGLKSFIEELNSIDSGIEKVNTLSTAFDGLKSIIAAAGITIGVSALFNTVNDMQAAINKFQASTGSSNKEMELYSQDIKYLYSLGMGEDIFDTSDTMALIKNNTKFDDEEVFAIANNALALRDTFDFDVAESIRAVQMLIDQFGVSGKEAFNLIVQGAQSGLNKNDDLMDTINEYSVHFKQLGFNSEDMFNMLNNGALNGTFSVDKLGDSIKEFGIRVIDGSNTTIEGFKAIGLNADDMAIKFKEGGEIGKEAFIDTISALKSMTDPIAQNTAGVNLFGTMWEDLGFEGVFALSNINGNILKTKEAMEEINNIRYDDASSALTVLARTINVAFADAMSIAVNKSKTAIIDFSQGIYGNADAIKGTFGNIGLYIRNAVIDFAAGINSEINAVNTAFGRIGIIVRGVGNTIISIATFIKKNISWIAPVVMTAVAAFATFKAIVLAVNTVLIIHNTIEALSIASSALRTSTTFSAVAAMKTAKGAQIGLNTALLASPITWIIIGIVALIAVIATLVVNWKKIKPVLLETWDSFKNVWGKAADWFKTTFVEPVVNFFTELINSIKNIWGGIVEWFQNIINNIITVISGIGENLSGIWGNIRAAVSNGINGIFNFIKSLFMGYLKIMFNIYIKPFIIAFNIIKPILLSVFELVKTVFNSIIQIITTVCQGIWNKITEIWNSIVTTIDNILHNIWNKITEVWNNIVTTIINILHNIWNKITETWNSITAVIGNISYNIQSKIIEVWNNITTVIGNILYSVQSKIIEIWNSITTIWNSIINTIKTALSEIYNKITLTWNNILMSVNSFLSDIWNKITSKFNELVSWFKNLKTKFINAGKDIMGGLISGITSKINELTSKVREIGNTVLSGIRNIFDINSPSKEMFKIGGFIGQGLSLGIEDVKRDIERSVINISSIVDSNIIPRSDNSEYTPEKSALSKISNTNNSTTENNNYSPVLNFTINGTNLSTKELKRLIKQSFKEFAKEEAESFNRRNPRLTRV